MSESIGPLCEDRLCPASHSCLRHRDSGKHPLLYTSWQEFAVFDRKPGAGECDEFIDASQSDLAVDQDEIAGDYFGDWFYADDP